MLEEVLLPKVYDPTGFYSQEAFLKATAYRVLAHAEIESYLEERVKNIAIEAVKAWKERRTASRTLAALLAFSGILMDVPPDTIYPADPSQKAKWHEKISLSGKIDKAKGSFIARIITNHGMKEENILRLLLPIGFEVDKIDTVLLADMNSFGERRGEAAHTSISTRRQYDPKDELQIVKAIAKGLGQLDEGMEALKGQGAS